MENIWSQFNKKPFFVLAPMDDVTDTVFREIVASVGTPDVSMTEFASTDGYAHPKGRPSVERRLKVNASERAMNVPIVAQIWGNNPDNYREMAKDLAKSGQFVGIDINMGCPEKGIVKRGCCGGLINDENWENAAAIIEATKEGAGTLPVSVKTRIGVSTINTEKWISFLLKQNIAALTVHGRTVKEMSKVPAHWDEIKKAVELRDKLSPNTIIIGNGDVENIEHGKKFAKNSGVDGIMIGRGVLRDIQAFTLNKEEISAVDRIKLFEKHLNLYQETWGETKSFAPIKKFAKLYISGFPGAVEVRTRIMDCHNYEEAKKIVSEITTSKI